MNHFKANNSTPWCVYNVVQPPFPSNSKTPKENPEPTKQFLLTLLTLASGNHQSAFCIWIRLSWTFHINVITRYVAFYASLLSRSTFSRFIHIMACVSTSLSCLIDIWSMCNYDLISCMSELCG